MDTCECCGEEHEYLETVTDGRRREHWVCSYCRTAHGYRPEAHDDER